MTQQRFLDRCKVLNEILIFNVKNLKKVLDNTNLPSDEYKEFRSFRLLQVLSNTLDLTLAENGDLDTWKSIGDISVISDQNQDLTTLFTLNDFRQIDGHLKNPDEIYEKLENIGFDRALLEEGYGRAFDHILDCLLMEIQKVSDKINKL